MKNPKEKSKKAPKKVRLEVPKHFKKFVKKYPDIAKHYHGLSKASRAIGALDQKTAALVKLGIAVGLQHEGAVHSHTRKSLEAGASKAQIRQVIVLSLTTIGFPSMMAALTWADDILEKA